MNQHVKRPRIATLDGIFVLDPVSGHYEPETEPDPVPYPASGLILIAACLIGWAAFVSAGYALYRAFQALA